MPKKRQSSNKSDYKKLTEIEDEYKYYQENMEKHPLYNSTWKVFWQKKYAELKRERKVDPDKYDYKSDWIEYWSKYLKDFYENKLNFYTKKSVENNLSPISISSFDSLSNNSRHGRSRSKDKLNSSFESTPKKKYRKRSSSFSSIGSDPYPSNSVKLDAYSSKEETITLLSVCRLLSVLDVELGNLLSNKIVDLVAQSIELEKLQANSSDEILMTNENITFLETIKEKLKGLLSTNLLDTKKVPVAKKCVQNIAQLVHQNPLKNVENDNMPVNNVNTKLAEIITKALANCGKTNISPEELEVILEIYLEELDKNAEKATQNHMISKSNTIAYKNLDDNELKILVKNFTQLCDEEQLRLISFISDIENTEPERVQKLQESIDDNNSNSNDQKIIPIIEFDDDEDYNFDELIAKIK